MKRTKFRIRRSRMTSTLYGPRPWYMIPPGQIGVRRNDYYVSWEAAFNQAQLLIKTHRKLKDKR